MDKVEQSGTLLGMFSKWAREDGELRLFYEGGVRCWGGEARAAKVRVQCGAQNEIISVTEPNRCQYEVVFKSPVACTEQLMASLAEAVEKDKELLKEEL